MFSRPTFSSPAARRIWKAGERFALPRIVPPPPPPPKPAWRAPRWAFAEPAPESAAPQYPTIHVIQDAVCERFAIPRVELLSQRRARTVVRPRQMAMYLAKVLTPRSLPEIGRRFGGRDHTTVLHAVRKIEALIAAGDPIAEDIAAIRAKLSGEG